MRVRALPFSKEVGKFLEKYDQVIVVEMNRDGQMYQLLCVDYPALAPKLRSVAFQDGLPASAKWIREGILSVVKKAAPKKKATPKKAVAKPSLKSKKPVKKSTVKKGAKK